MVWNPREIGLLVWISGEFESSEFELSGSYCTEIYALKSYDENIENFMESAGVRYLLYARVVNVSEIERVRAQQTIEIFDTKTTST